jgi:ribonuclease HII
MKEKEENRLSLLKVEENKLYESGIEYVCGIDEAGRGPLAGPVVVGAVILPKASFIEGVNDSKKVSEKKREKIYDQIIEEAVAYSVRNSRPKDY